MHYKLCTLNLAIAINPKRVNMIYYLNIYISRTPDEIEWIILVPMTWDIKQKQDFRKTVETVSKCALRRMQYASL